MAKGKKSEPSKSQVAAEAPSASETTTRTKAAAKPAVEAGAAKPAAGRGKPANSKKAAKAAAAPVAAPLIDTNLAAQTAARMLAQRNANPPAAGGSAPAAPAAPMRESSTFQRIKGNVGAPSAGLSNILGGAPDQKKSQQTFGGGKQTGRNQSFGSAGKHFGVPRRTSG